MAKRSKAKGADHYTYRVFWSPEDGEFVASCLEFPSLSWLSDDRVDALIGLQKVVADVLADMAASGEAAPKPITDQEFSGKYALRMPQAVHRRLTIEAAEQGISLSRLINAKIAV